MCCLQPPRAQCSSESDLLTSWWWFVVLLLLLRLLLLVLVLVLGAYRRMQYYETCQAHGVKSQLVLLPGKFASSYCMGNSSNPKAKGPSRHHTTLCYGIYGTLY